MATHERTAGRPSRRNVVGLLGTLPALGLPGTPKPTGAAPRNRLWKTAVGLNGFESAAKSGKGVYPIWEVLDFVARWGFDGVELVAAWPMGPYPKANETARIAALRRLYDGFGLQIFALQLSAEDAFAPDAGTRARWLEQIEDRAALAKQLGCVHLGLWPLGGLRGQSFESALHYLVDSFQGAAEIAAKHGLVAAFEIEPPFVFNSEEHLKKILSRVKHRHMKTIYDPSHFDVMTGAKGTPHAMLARVGVENIGYVHLTDSDGTVKGTSRHLPVGDGHANIPTSLALLRKEGYRGWIMIDGYRTDDPYDAAAKGKQALDKAAA